MIELKNFTIVARQKSVGKRLEYQLAARSREQALEKFRFRHRHKLKRIEIVEVKEEELKRGIKNDKERNRKSA